MILNIIANNTMSPESQLMQSIADLIKQTELNRQHTLTPKNVIFLRETLHKSVLRRITKYIKGSAEHGDEFLTEVDHLQEALLENDDQSFYLEAAINTKLAFDIRYNAENK